MRDESPASAVIVDGKLPAKARVVQLSSRLAGKLSAPTMVVHNCYRTRSPAKYPNKGGSPSVYGISRFGDAVPLETRRAGVQTTIALTSYRVNWLQD